MNPNHPKKGSVIKVEPIRTLADIKKIKNILTRPQDLAIFVVGINTSLRASDLCNIKIEDVHNLEAMGEVEIREQKTGKTKRVIFNAACVGVIKSLLTYRGLSGTYLFQGRNGSKATTIYICSLIKRFVKKAGLNYHVGSHTLRKTFAYHSHKTFKQPLPNIMVALNHSNQKQTLDYLCICSEEMISTFANVL